ncbi:MAG: hypothetical protein NT062_28395 [Proteobacteria bacterium]|nr:hypothetical protein [Pseudomonadota bacterium]
MPRLELPEAHRARPVPALPERVPRHLADAILHALAKDPDARWPTALAFGEAVQRAVGGAVVEVVPIFEPATRETWTRGAPQPIADAVAHLAGATTTVEADAALRELVAIACRWLACIALAQLGAADAGDRDVRARARAIVGHDDGGPWLALARAAAGVHPLPGLDAALAGSEPLAALALRLDDRDRPRSLVTLASDIAAAADALRSLEPLLAYQLVVGCEGVGESWQGTRRRDRERVVVWGEPLVDGEAALLDGTGRVVVRLAPFVQIVAPLPSAEPEVFLLWRGGRGAARLMAAPWGFERDYDAAGARLSQLATEQDAPPADPTSDRSPYAGLLPYGAADAARFVGREREIEALANRLVRSPLLAVLGPSGAGKSSFIHAGVLPRLAEHYEILAMRPGRHPLHVLAALPPVDVDTEDSAGLILRLRALGERSARGLVIVIDQFEELVTLCTDDAERTRFAETIAAVADDPGSPVRVVVTLRDDFATVIEREDALRGRFDVFVLAAPSAASLRRICIEPARRAGVLVDPRVVDDMVAAVVGRPASLPLLSFTASQLWQTRDRATLRITHEAYAALGGVAGALSTYADQVFESLARPEQELVRDLFARLVATDGTRIPVARRELEEVTGGQVVLAHLIDARLLVVREADGVDIVEVVHECLADRWQRLARWRSEDAADRALLGDVSVAARRWSERRDPDLLWRGQALHELRRLAAGSALTATELAFARESARAFVRARRLRRGLASVAFAALASVAIVMGYLGLVANRSRAAAEHSATEAHEAAGLAEERLTASLVAQGRRELNDDRGLAALAFFGAALERGADSPGLRLMLGLASRAWPFEKLVVRDLKVSTFVRLAAPGELVVADHFGKLRWYRDGVSIGELATELGGIFSLRLRGGRLLVVGRSGLAVVDVATRAITLALPLATEPLAATWRADEIGDAIGDEIVVVVAGSLKVFGADGKLRREAALPDDSTDVEPTWGGTGQTMFIALGTTIHAIDTRTMTQTILERETYDGPVAAPDGAVVGWLDRARTVHLVGSDGAPLRTFKPANNPDQLVISADGRRLGTVSEHALELHEITGALVRTLAMGSNQTMIALRGDDVWAGTSSGTVRRYVGDRLVASLPVHVTEVADVRIAGDQVAAIGSDAALVMLDAGARHVTFDEPACASGSYVNQGLAMGYRCEGASTMAVYVGRGRLGVIDSSELEFASRDRVTGRGVAVGAKTVVAFGPDGTTLATTRAHVGPAAFVDADHLVVAAIDAQTGEGRTLWRWTYATDAWEVLGPLPVHKAIGALAMAAGGLVYGGDAEVGLVDPRTLAERHHETLADPVDYLTVSGDGRWVAVTLVTGGTLLLDGTTGAIVRRFAPADAIGVAAGVDSTGELLARPSRGGVTIWDRSGDELVWGFDLLRPAVLATFDAQGRIELVGRQTGVLEITADRRPVQAIVGELACRVPLRVTSGRLEPNPPTACSSASTPRTLRP